MQTFAKLYRSSYCLKIIYTKNFVHHLHIWTNLYDSIASVPKHMTQCCELSGVDLTLVVHPGL